jgi:long-chain fatty acid transport protein
MVAMVVPSLARANPIDAFGFGSRAPAMGNAATADSDDSSANYYNPAGLARGKTLDVDVGYRYAQPIAKLNGRDLGIDASRGFAVGIAAPGNIGPFRFAFGAALWLPDQRLDRVRSLPYTQPRFIYYDNRMQRLLLSTNLAIQILPGLYLGGGLTFMSRTSGDLALRGSVAVSDPDESSLVTATNVDLVAIRYPQAGILWDVTSRLSLGASYRHSFRLDLDQSFRIDGSVGNPGVTPVVPSGFLAAHAIANDQFQPWQLTGGARLRITPRFLVTYDLTFARWSEMPNPASTVSLSLDIGVFNNKVHLPPARSYAAPYFHDIVIPRIGAEWRALERERLALEVRAGYSYEPSPVPEQIYDSNFADCDKHTFSAGVGLDLHLAPILSQPLSIDAHVALTVLPPRANRKVDPLDAVGDFVASGVVPQLGLMMRSRF